ncbi:MAG TPA: TonB-dependent receptor [Polyangiaceae bacterium]|nr:TonB-dependent receptor [Polyangiaceae bacterium]
MKPRLTRPPALVTFVEADYPESEKAAGRAAAVVLRIGIGADGTVTDVAVLESAGAAFDAAAVAAAKRFVFTPAEVDGKPAPIRIAYRYEFVLKPAAPTTGILTGVVRARPGGEPLAGVTVALDDGTSVVTDATGHFTFPDLTPGRRRVLLSRSDLKGLQTEEEIVAGEKLEATYEIEQAPVEDEGEHDDLEIVVVAPKLVKQTVSTKVEAAEGRRVAGTQGDVLKIVENLPGVARATAGSSQIVVWGAAPEDTRVYVDGLRVPLLYHFGGLRSVVHTDLVNSVELVPGGYGAAYGRGLGGLIVVETRDPPKDRLHGSVQVDVIDASAAVQGPAGAGWSFAVAARHSHLDSVLDAFTSKDFQEFFQIPHYYDAQARLRRELRPNEFVEILGLLSSDSVSRTVESSDPNGQKSETKDQRFQRVGLRYKRVLKDGSSAEVLPWIGWDHSDLTSRFGSVPTSLALDSNIFGLRATYSGKLGDAAVATVGLDLEGTNTTAVRSGSTSSPPREGDAHVFGQPPSDQINGDRWQSFIGSAAPFVQVDLGLFSDALHVVPGVRFDPLFVSVARRLPQDGNNPGVGAYSADLGVEPRVSLRYRLSKRATLKAAYGEYRQPPQPEDLSAVFGNPLLGVASGKHVLGGGEFALSPTIGVETTVFYTHSKGLAARNPLPSPLVAEALLDIGEGRSYGAQFLIRRNLANGFFGWVAYTLLRAERRDQPGTPFRLFDFDQTHVLTALAAYQLGKGFDVSARFRYATGYPRTPVIGSYFDARRDLYEPELGPKNSTRLPDFWQLDVRFAKRFNIGTTELETYLDVQNVTDRQNPEEIAYSPDYTQKRYIDGLPILPVIGARWGF